MYKRQIMDVAAQARPEGFAGVRLGFRSLGSDLVFGFQQNRESIWGHPQTGSHFTQFDAVVKSLLIALIQKKSLVFT